MVHMVRLGHRRASVALIVLLVTAFAHLRPSRHAMALDAGQPAPDFKLPSTMGGDVSLGDFRGKKWVLLEFYGADFSPT